MINSAKVHFLDFASDFLDFLLKNDAPTTTLIICSTRDTFLQQLASSTLPRDQAQETEVPSRNATTAVPLLLTNTISFIEKLQRVKLAFCPSLEVLRAYLSTLRASTPRPGPDRPQGKPLLAVLNMVAIHCPTLELSAQGLSRTFALTAEVAARENMNIAVCECKDIIAGEHDREPGSGRWDMHVPLLNASVRSGKGERAPAGRTVTVKRIAQKWFDFDMTNVTIDIMDI